MDRNLFGGSDESEGEELQLGTNKEYAKSYNNFRKKELLKKFKDRGYDVADSESSDSETSSEEDEPLDSKFDQEFLKTLASLKSKDPAIYDKNTKFFEMSDGEDDTEDDSKSNLQREKRSKPIMLKDYERQIILEKGGKFEDDSDADSEEASKRPSSPTLVEEERQLKEEFKKVINASHSDNEEDEEEAFGGIFKKRNKSKEEKDKEEADYLKWLAGETAEIEDPIKEKLEPLKNYWNSNKLPQSERFLRDFILNKGYANTKSSEIPTYDEIVGDDQPLSEDEKELEKQAEFEQKYNFRFEEPDTEFIKRYPRTIEQSLRQSDDRRKQKRQELKERKKLEKEQKMKELDMIKEMKRKEIEEKIRKLKMVTGNDELGFKDEELEEDFDPEAHDKRMQELFNEDYYKVDEGEEKPECPSDIDELKVEDWDNYDPNRDDDDEQDYGLHCEDEDFNMDCDYDPTTTKEQLQKELIENTKRRKGRKGRKSEFMEMIKTEKPAFNPDDEKTYEEYIEEYYKLDCEDMIGDTPCRFKYVETTPNDFGLTIEEILLAKNKELNQWASLKKAIQIRPEQLEKKDQRLYRMKAKNEELKRKIFKSLYGDVSDEEGSGEERTDANLQSKPQTQNSEDSTEQAQTTTIASKKSNKRKKRKAQIAATLNGSAGAVAPETLDVPDKKLKLGDDTETNKESAVNKVNVEMQGKKKRKKRKAKTNKADALTLKTSPVSAPNQNITVNGTQQPQGKKIKQQKSMNPFKSTQHANARNKPLLSTNNSTKNTTNNQQSRKAPNHALKNPFKSGPSHGKTNNNFASPEQKGKFKQNAKKFNKSSSSKATTNGSDANISDERLKAYGINPRKFHRKQKYGKPQA